MRSEICSGARRGRGGDFGRLREQRLTWIDDLGEDQILEARFAITLTVFLLISVWEWLRWNGDLQWAALQRLREAVRMGRLNCPALKKPEQDRRRTGFCSEAKCALEFWRNAMSECFAVITFTTSSRRLSLSTGHIASAITKPLFPK
jgi:hypothetical protein